MITTKAREYLKFYERQEKEEKEFKDAGMNDSQIAEMQQFDRHQFARDIAYQTHRCELLDIEQMKGSNCSQYAKRLREALNVDMDMSYASRYWWLEEIESPELSARLKKLNDVDIEFLTLLAMDDCTQSEIAERMHCSEAAVSQRKMKIRRILTLPKKDADSYAAMYNALEEAENQEALEELEEKIRRKWNENDSTGDDTNGKTSPV